MPATVHDDQGGPVGHCSVIGRRLGIDDRSQGSRDLGGRFGRIADGRYRVAMGARHTIADQVDRQGIPGS